MLLATIGDGVELRLLEMRHALAYHELFCANLDRLYWMSARPNVEESEQRVRKGLQRLADGSGFTAGIFDGGVLCGIAGLTHGNSRLQSAELGYWIGKGAEGRGLVTKACRAILNYGFAELGLRRIEARCAATNYRSLAVLQRLGFREEGRLRESDCVDGAWVDLVIFGLLASEWREQRDQPPQG